LVLFPDRLQWLTNLTTREPSASASDSNSSTFPLRQIPSTDFSPGVDRAMRLRLPKFNQGGRPLGRIAGISELCRSMGGRRPPMERTAPFRTLSGTPGWNGLTLPFTGVYPKYYSGEAVMPCAAPYGPIDFEDPRDFLSRL
jgi:hypothetical protein